MRSACATAAARQIVERRLPVARVLGLDRPRFGRVGFDSRAFVGGPRLVDLLHDFTKVVGNVNCGECRLGPAGAIRAGARLGDLGREREVARCGGVEVGAQTGEPAGSSFGEVACRGGRVAQPGPLRTERFTRARGALSAFARGGGHAVVPAEIEERAQDRDTVAGPGVQERRELALGEHHTLGELLEVEADEPANGVVELVLLPGENVGGAVVVHELEPHGPGCRHRRPTPCAAGSRVAT